MDDGGGLMPFQRKMHSLAWQFGQRGEGFMSMIPESISVEDTSTNNGITMMLTCQKDGLANEWKCESKQRGNHAGNWLCLPLKVHQ